MKHVLEAVFCRRNYNNGAKYESDSRAGEYPVRNMKIQNIISDF